MTEKRKTTSLRLSAASGLAAAVLCLAAMSGRSQSFPVGGTAHNFTAVEYFQGPYQQQVKSRLSGAEAQPLPGGLLLVKQINLETFDTNGSPQIIANAPECIYDPAKGVANSTGDVHMHTGNGDLRIDGKGFLWRQSDSSLTISNQVQTIIEKVPGLSP